MNQHIEVAARELLTALQPNEYAPDTREAWQPHTLDEVDWCAQKAAEADRQYQAAAKVAQAQIERIQAWLDGEKTKRDNEVNYFEGHAVTYLLKQRAEEAERGIKPDRITKTLKLPGGGSVQARQLPERVNVLDEDAAMQWAEANDATHLVRVKRSLALTEVKKFIKDNGELPDGVTLEEGMIKVSLTLPEGGEE